MAKITKAKITKVGHVVLGCRDPQASIKFYTETYLPPQTKMLEVS